MSGKVVTVAMILPAPLVERLYRHLQPGSAAVPDARDEWVTVAIRDRLDRLERAARERRR